MSVIDQWTIAAGEPLISADWRSSGSIRYDDPDGPLVISRIEGSEPSYSLEHPGDFVVEVHPGRRMTMRRRPGVPQFTLDHFIRDQVMPRIVSHEGNLVLHAAGVRVGDGVILIMGRSGQGKSTLATSFDKAGFPMIGDDAILIDLVREPKAQAVHPSLRLFPDSIDALFDQPVTSEPVAHYSSKQSLTLPDITGVPPLPVKAIYRLSSPLKDELTILRLIAPAPACIELIENSFALDPADLQRSSERLKLAAALANRVPVYDLSFRRNYAQLAEVRDEMLGVLHSRAAA